MAPPKRLVTVTYMPVNEDDRVSMTWNKIIFRANVPVVLDRKNPAHWYPQYKRTEGTHPITGGLTYKYTEEPVFMGETAKGNPSLDVDGVRPKHIFPTAKVPPAGAEWGGTHRDELVPADQINYPTDIDPSAEAVMIG